MNLLDTLLEFASTVGLEAFRRRVPGFYLFGGLGEVDVPGTGWALGASGTAATRVGRPQQLATEVVRASRFCFAVAPREPRERPYRITVGRAADNDIVMRHSSISKHHAHFMLTNESDILMLADVNSLNGTFVDGELIKRDDIVPLHLGAKLMFGELRCRFLDGAMLYQELQPLAFEF